MLWDTAHSIFVSVISMFVLFWDRDLLWFDKHLVRLAVQTLDRVSIVTSHAKHRKECNARHVTYKLLLDHSLISYI